MDDWGSKGPVLGPYELTQATYAFHLKLIKSDGNCNELMYFEDMLYYDGVYYGDWGLFSSKTFKESNFKVTHFEKEIANLPVKKHR